jgi:hypothetical protein
MRFTTPDFIKRPASSFDKIVIFFGIDGDLLHCRGIVMANPAALQEWPHVNPQKAH